MKNWQANRKQTAQPRRGSTLLIVIALLSLLMFMGFVFYTFAAQEQSSAEYFAEAHKEVIEEQHEFFEFGLRQLIMGAHDQFETQSALYGHRHAMAWNMLGDDLSPGSSEGIRLTGSGGNVSVSSGLPSFLDFNDSPAALGQPLRDDQTSLPAADPSYTAPDINNLFVAFHGDVFQKVGNSAPKKIHVSIPSFHRPQYLRHPSGQPIYNWYESADTAKRVMRPHPKHVVVNANGEPVLDSNNNYIPRFSNDPNSPVGAFPFKPALTHQNGRSFAGEQGIFTEGALTDDPATGFDDTEPPDPDVYELDVNNVNPGSLSRDAVWLDLAHAMLETATGQLNYVPLFSFTVLDADALLNLNIHGNVNGVDGLGAKFGMQSDRGFVYESSRSNQGVMGPAEVNPLWGMHDDLPQSPTLAMNKLRDHFGRYPIDYQEARNMEWWFLNVGRPEYSSSGTVDDLHAGRYGELRLLYQKAQLPLAGRHADYSGYPAAGVTLLDDNNNLFEGDGTEKVGRYIYPMDYTGLGREDFLTYGWPVFTNYERNAASSPNSPLWPFTAPSWPSFNLEDKTLGDDPLEIIVEPDHEQRPQDEIFGPQDLAFLFLSNADASSVGASDRLKELAPFYFDNEDVRQRYTTMSWARNQFMLSRSATNRQWEFERDNRFPPVFSNSNQTIEAYSAEDPFRIPVRRLLEVHRGNRNNISRQMPISVNQLLDVQRRPGRISDTAERQRQLRNELQLRSLTNHPTLNMSLSTVSAVSGGEFPNFPPQTDGEREFWARRDRQLLARDIYVLLYTFCGPNGNQGNQNNTTSPPAVYDAAELEKMAQFAVNLVDAMDRDSVMTRFEYDTDLSNGWNLDDNPFTTTHQFSGASEADRKIVTGIERQELALSEGLVIRQTPLEDQTTMTPVDDTELTAHDDGGPSTDRLVWMYLELQNVGPTNFDVPLAYDDNPDTAAPGDGTDRADDGIWRIVRSDQGVGDVNELTFMKSAGTVRSRTHPSKGLFTVGTSDREYPISGNTADLRPSYFLADIVDDPNDPADDGFEFIVPYRLGPTDIEYNTPTSNQAYANYHSLFDIDLIRTDWNAMNQTNARRSTFATRSNTIAGDFAQNLGIGTGTVTFKLQRRLNPLLPGLADTATANPWVTVDEISVTVTDLDFDKDNRSQIFTETKKLVSTERRYSNQQLAPLNRDVESPRSQAREANTIGRATETIAKDWQIHFDRDLGSLAELFSIPTFGPDKLTNSLVESYRSPPGDLAAFEFGPRSTRPGPNPNANPNANPQRNTSNWHRLLGLVSVPTRVHRQLGQPLNIPRVPGKINLSMVRHPEVLGALIDDPRWVEPMFAAGGYSELLGLQHPSSGRRWWQEFLGSRDGVWSVKRRDPNTGSEVEEFYYVPGLPDGKPFRSTLESSYREASLQLQTTDSIYRHNKEGQDPTKMLFELSDAEYDNTVAGNSTDGAMGRTFGRHAVLSKIANNVTTTSNVFAVYMTVGFFKAHQDPATGAVQIGERLDRTGGGQPDQDFIRGLFILDRSAFEDYAFDGDWKKVVKHAEILD